MTAKPTHPGSSALQIDAATRKIVDDVDGIDRLMGDRRLYARMLARFRQDYRAGVLPIRRALATGDPVLAHRIAHTIKGAAGMIGAHTLHWQACVVERSLRMHAPETDRDINALEPVLEQVLFVLDIMLGAGQDGPAAGDACHAVGDAALLAQLRKMLGDGAAGVPELLEQAGISLRRTLGDTVWQEISAAVGEFNYEAALAALARSGQALGE